jgi:hypothetical protein
MLQRLAKHGWSKNPMIQTYLDGLLAPTAYWHVQQQSMKKRLSDTKDLKDFDNYWKHILLPTKTYNDIFSGWSQNQRFRAVARLEYLRSRYLNTPTYLDAQLVMSRGLNSENEDLPSRKDVLDVFNLHDWKWDNMEGMKIGSGADEDVYKNKIMKERLITLEDGEYDLNSPIDQHWDLVDILEVGGCCVHGRSEFNLFAEENQLYEVLTMDYVEALANQICQLRQNKANYQVCEVGAGSGLLTHHLKRCLDRMEGTDGIDMIATDSGSWNLGKRFDVEPYTNKEAIKRFRPDLVLVSWMPAGEDWTAYFRRSGVKNYIIIGESDDGCTGHNWETWGNYDYCDEDRKKKKFGMVEEPLFSRDGYYRTDLKELASLQLQRYDCRQAPYQSTTVLFTKKN